jgi:hypothetical protein
MDPWSGPSGDRGLLHRLLEEVIRKQTTAAPPILTPPRGLSRRFSIWTATALGYPPELSGDCGTINHIYQHFSLLYLPCLYVDQKANHQSLLIMVSPEETLVKVCLLMALFVAATPIAAKAEIIDRPWPVGDQSRFANHKEFAAVSAPVAVAAVRAAGLAPATLPVKIGSTYVMRAVDRRGTKFRIVLAANTGQILAIHSPAAQQDDVNKPLGNSRAKSKLGSPSTARAPALSVARPPVGSPPMQILPRTASFPHKIASVAHPVSLAVTPPVGVASNEGVEARIPATLLGTLRSVGLTPASAPVKVEPTYVVQAVNQRGMTLRVLLAANSGDILAIQLTRGAPRRERHDGETLGAADSAPSGALAGPTEPRLPAVHPQPSSETSFVAP